MFRNVLSALAVAVFGLVLLNLTFLVDYLFHTLALWALGFFVPTSLMGECRWIPLLMHISFAAAIILFSFVVFKSKLGTLLKAIYMTVPLAVIFVTLGIMFYQWPVVPFMLSISFGLLVLYYLYRAKQPWIYYYTLFLVGLSLAAFTLLGGEI